MGRQNAGEVLFGDSPDGDRDNTHYADRMMDAMGAEAFGELFVEGGDPANDDLSDEQASEEDGGAGSGESDESEEGQHGSSDGSGSTADDANGDPVESSDDNVEYSSDGDGPPAGGAPAGTDGVVNDSGSLSDPRYLELRDAHNRALWEKQQLEKQLEERERAAREIRQADAPTTEQIVAYASEDVHGAFAAAFEHGDNVAIQQIIAQVNQAAYRLAGRAEVASSEGDEKLAAECDAQSLKLTRMATGMMDSYQAALRQAEADAVREQYEASLAPFREDRLVTSLRAAASEAFSVLDGFQPTPEQVAGMNEYIRNHEAQSVGRSHKDAVAAFQRAAIEVVYGGQAGYVEHLVNARIQQRQQDADSHGSAPTPPRGASGGVGGSTPPPPAATTPQGDKLTSSRRRRDLGDPYKILFG